MFWKKKVDLSSYLDDEPTTKIENNEEKTFTRKVDTSALTNTITQEENKLEEKSSDLNDEKIEVKDNESINYTYETSVEEKETEAEAENKEEKINYIYEVNLEEANEPKKTEKEIKKEEKDKKYVNLLNWDVRKTIKEEPKKEESEDERKKRYEEITSKIDVELEDEKFKKIEKDVELFSNYTSDYKEKEVENTKNSDNEKIKTKKILKPKQKIILIVSVIIILLISCIWWLFFTEKNWITNFWLFIKENNLKNEFKDDLKDEDINKISEWKMNSKNVNWYDITFEERDNYLDKEYKFYDEIFSSIEGLDISINKYLEELIWENEELTKEEIEELIREKIIRIYLQRTINR